MPGTSRKTLSYQSPETKPKKISKPKSVKNTVNKYPRFHNIDQLSFLDANIFKNDITKCFEIDMYFRNKQDLFRKEFSINFDELLPTGLEHAFHLQFLKKSAFKL